MARRWLFKTEPGAYSFDRLEKDGRTVWDGVRNPLARKHLADVRRGDLILIYHTGAAKEVVGVARALGDAYVDPRAGDPKAVVVDIAPGDRLRRPVTLATLKSRPTMKTFPLVRLPRLSVMPVSTREWAEIERLSAP